MPPKWGKYGTNGKRISKVSQHHIVAYQVTYQWHWIRKKTQNVIYFTCYNLHIAQISWIPLLWALSSSELTNKIIILSNFQNYQKYCFLAYAHIREKILCKMIIWSSVWATTPTITRGHDSYIGSTGLCRSTTYFPCWAVLLCIIRTYIYTYKSKQSHHMFALSWSCSLK